MTRRIGDYPSDPLDVVRTASWIGARMLNAEFATHVATISVSIYEVDRCSRGDLWNCL
jgi:hypothetical protein